jgi:uncharacterized repeat protein (TIGR01451 family)/gliding motility-associated-like protein
LSNITVTDPLPGLSSITYVSGDANNDGILDLDEVWTYTATYSITQDDINEGQVVNQALATGQAPNGDTVEDLSGTAVDNDTPTVTDIPQQPAIALVKTGFFNDVNGDGYAQIGETITYTFVVTNAGNVPLSNITINDPLPGLTPLVFAGGDSNGNGILDLNETWVYTAVYAITQSDIDAGQVVNQAIATGTSPNGDVVEDLSGTAIDNDTPTITILPQNPQIAIVKTGVFNDENGDTYAQVGETITYTFTVSNQGNVPLSNITVTDPLPGLSAISYVSGDNNNNGILDLNEIWVYTATYAITQEDINEGQVVNQALATGDAPNGDTVEDLSGTDLDNDTPTITDLPQDPAIAIVKTGVFNDENGDTYAQVGETITYTFTVSNQGNVPLSNITVTDPLPGLSAITFVGGDDNGDGILDLDEVWTYTASYTITQLDIEAGQVVNQALATGDAPDGTTVEDESGTGIDTDDPTITILPQNPAIAIVKTGVFNDENGDTYAQVGETITYTFEVSNVGNVALANITITDPLPGLSAITFVGGDDNGDGILDLDEVWTYTASYTITQLDIEAGQVVNQALATGDAPDGTTVEDESGTEIGTDDPTIVVLPNNAVIALLKEGVYSAQGDCSTVGDLITYTFTVTNEGNVSLSNIVLTDPLFEAPNQVVPIEFVGGDLNNDGILDVDEVWVFTAVYAITQNDIDIGEVVNQALVQALDPEGILVTDLSGTDFSNDLPTIIELCQEMGIALEKVGVFDDNNGDGSAQVGETITYLFTVYNTGSVTLYNITIDDPLVPVQGGPIASLAPGESDFGTFTATYVITQQDINAGEVVNQATVYAEDFYGIIIEDLSDDPNDPTNNDINGNGNPDDPTVVVLPLVLGVDFEIFNGITPGNNDGLNDFFRIRGIENFPNNNVQIFNRWGVLVFERDNYNNAGNAFVGVSEGRVTVKQGEELPTGTYYYIIRFFGDQNPGRSNYSGYLYLNR